ncbi:MAG TPA: hypothetical protein VK824_11185, partial [Planctomycetota bacterium]|nr:hypothetical protein [Planctomycetota bacterium]
FHQGDWIAELFDLQADPGEEHNLAPAQPDVFLGLMARHAAASQVLLPRGADGGLPAADAAGGLAPGAAWPASSPGAAGQGIVPPGLAPPPAPADPAEAERLEHLRALGYVR